MMNKYLTLVILFSLCIVSGFSQSKTQTIATIDKSAKNNIKSISYSRALADVFYPTFGDTCADRIFTFFATPAWGSISGMNGFMDLEKAQKLEFAGSESYRIAGLVAFVSQASVVGNGDIKMKVYTCDEDTGGPGQLIGQSVTQKVDELNTADTSEAFTLFGISDTTNIELTDLRFFVSIDFTQLYTSGDTVSVWQTDVGCGSGDDTWEKFSDGSWVKVNDEMLSWGINFDILLAAVVEFDEMTALDDFVASDQLKLYPAYPNPAKEAILIRFGLESSSTVSLEVFDDHGKRVQNIDKGFLSTGQYQELIDIQSLPAGSYYYRINTTQGHLMSRFVVQ